MKTSSTLWQKAILPPSATIQQAIQNLNELAIQIVLVVNHKGEFEGTISDGDIRRGLLKGFDLSSQIKSVVFRNPLVVPDGIERDLILKLMTTNKVLQIPILNEKNHVVGLHLWDEIMAPTERSNMMVIMAGGMGTRLRPHTENCPKPMLLVDGKPMLELIIERAKLEGFRFFVLSIHYLGHMIEDYFGNGEQLGLNISYLREESPLGTAGALSLLNPRPKLPFVVSNGDVISDIRYGELLDFHARQNAIATMAVRKHEWKHPFGVVEMKGVEIIGFEEKPIAYNHINAGVYALDPASLEHLVNGEACNMPNLFEKLQNHGKRIVAYPMHEPWLDVGDHEDLERVSRLKQKY